MTTGRIILFNNWYVRGNLLTAKHILRRDQNNFDENAEILHYCTPEETVPFLREVSRTIGEHEYFQEEYSTDRPNIPTYQSTTSSSPLRVGGGMQYQRNNRLRVIEKFLHLPFGDMRFSGHPDDWVYSNINMGLVYYAVISTEQFATDTLLVRSKIKTVRGIDIVVGYLFDNVEESALRIVYALEAWTRLRWSNTPKNALNFIDSATEAAKITGFLDEKFMRAVKKYDVDKVHWLMMQDGLKCYEVGRPPNRLSDNRRILIDKFVKYLLS